MKLKLVALLLVVCATVGIAVFQGTGKTDAVTFFLSAFPNPQILGGNVNVSISHNDDAPGNPTLTLSSGTWTAINSSSCFPGAFGGIGTPALTINDEFCDFDTISNFMFTNLATQCIAAGIVTVTSNLHQPGGPNPITFECVDVSDWGGRANLVAEDNGRGPRGRATLTPVDGMLVTSVDVRGLEPVTMYHLQIRDFDGCTVGFGSFVTDLGGDASATGTYPAASFLQQCQDKPAEIAVARNFPFGVVLKGDLR